MKRYRVPLLIALVVIVALAVFVGIRIREATSGTYRTQRQLQQVPEEHLFYPGSVVLTHGGTDRELDILGQRTRARSGYTLGTDATDDEIFAFYRERLSTVGWQSAPSEVTLFSGTRRGIAYRKGALLVQVTTLQQGDVRNPQAIDAYRTPYQITLYADMPK